jgi:hypothetical protein
MEQEGSGVSALVGLEGFVVLVQLLDEATGEWWLAVETTVEFPRFSGHLGCVDRDHAADVVRRVWW